MLGEKTDGRKGRRAMSRERVFGFLMRVNHVVHRVMLLIAQISILAMIAIVTLTVILRYCFNTGLSWAEEVPRLLVTVFAFLACAIGVRDHMHVAVNALYNRFQVDGSVRRVLDVAADLATLLCGLFMLISGGQRTAKLFTLPGVLPITGISTAWQYLPIPVAGFVITMDSILFLTGVLPRGDLLYSEQEIDYTDTAALAAAKKEG